MTNKTNKFISDLDTLLTLNRNYKSVLDEEFTYYREFKYKFLHEWCKELKTYDVDTKDWKK